MCDPVVFIEKLLNWSTTVDPGSLGRPENVSEDSMDFGDDDFEPIVQDRLGEIHGLTDVLTSFHEMLR